MSSLGAEETIQARRHRLAQVPRAITCRHPNDRSRTERQADKIANLEAVVDRLDRRCREVESRLVALESARLAPLAEREADQRISSVEPGPVGGRLFEGDSSFASQSLQMTESAQDAALSASAGDDPAIHHAFARLRKSLHDSHEVSRDKFHFRKSVSQSPPPVKPLPAPLVNSLLRRMRVRRPIFLSSYAISDLHVLEDLCYGVYATSAPSAGQIASTHGVLLFVLKEYVAMNDDLGQRVDLNAHLNECEHMFVAALEHYEVLVIPSFENILALTMGMIKAQGEAKPSLYWTLACAAATQCQSLGYHREASYRNIPSGKADSIRRLFWTVYCFDKNMSLLLGRVSSLHGLTIDTRYPSTATDQALRPWDESFIMGIRLAELQDRVLTGLYSPETAIKDSSERARLVRDLAAAMDEWRVQFTQIIAEAVNHPEVFHLSRGNWDMAYYSTLTLLYHASSTTETGLYISSQCVHAARNSLQAHLQCFPQYQESRLLSDGEYINWILLYSSFTPFLVIFLHTIAAKDPEGAALLLRVVGTLENLRSPSPQQTPGAERLYQICATFAQLAQKLVESPAFAGGVDNPSEDPARLAGEDVAVGDDGAGFGFPAETFEEVFGDVALNPAGDVLGEWMGGQPFWGNWVDF
ncbi:fungal specific transcription factor domain-containing protein [Aspergillus brunneoviolaceus CBS 621.78]|uniref:Uncharacterized protein n=1 Tax=Aspergillus brunneoviolaceus CBS 621.78 TaxID=1450534 RepID=A0ACD1GGE6_9EURO|nr:hypothetical protein BO95DRAFT_491065 [Aspergillus brunneoviolaceus CBS 621.78]RAH48306.1 hypothetical protein BO95DRAFT_491065 [Aspergillus brunneoviolaceus CBS 621.78]